MPSRFFVCPAQLGFLFLLLYCYCCFCFIQPSSVSRDNIYIISGVSEMYAGVQRWRCTNCHVIWECEYHARVCVCGRGEVTFYRAAESRGKRLKVFTTASAIDGSGCVV